MAESAPEPLRELVNGVEVEHTGTHVLFNDYGGTMVLTGRKGKLKVETCYTIKGPEIQDESKNRGYYSEPLLHHHQATDHSGKVNLEAETIAHQSAVIEACGIVARRLVVDRNAELRLGRK